MKITHIPPILKAIEEENRFRSIYDLHRTSATSASDRQGKQFLICNSNDYLGLSHEPSVIAAAKKALAEGTGAGGARLMSGASFSLTDLETEWAQFKETEAALIFNTGYMANLGLLYALVDKNDVIFSDQWNHASIIDGCRLARGRTVIYDHNDMEDLEEKLQDIPCRGQRFLITDGIFSMDGDIAPLPRLLFLKKKYNALLIVDEAHATGVIGETGRGLEEHFGERGIDIHVGTLSKALGSVGGIIATSQDIITYLQNKSRPFIFSTALPPACGAAALEALRLLTTAPEKYVQPLHTNAYTLRKRLQGAGFPIEETTMPIIPLIVGEESQALAYGDACFNDGLLVTAIRPPSVPVGTSRLRLTITASHKPEDINTIAHSLIHNRNTILRKEKGTCP